MRWMFFIASLASCIGTIDSSPGPTPGGGHDRPDAATVREPDAAAVPDGPAFACRNQVPAGQLTSGNHNAGLDCMDACHNHGFTLAGTLYTSAAGVTAIQGGTITVTDAAGHTFDMVSQRNGNYYTSTAVMFPVTVIASECPSTTAMSATIANGSGGCNKTGCHEIGGQGHVHLP